ncbi:hypothetical protein [Sphingobacterium kitahiroshimense]|uniref:Uncharacterized protein n=1 Tax=Sphingobacterium kitahiroshimense TaxID=470446 RepID=A0ABV0BNN6_9SPHI
MKIIKASFLLCAVGILTSVTQVEAVNTTVKPLTSTAFNQTPFQLDYYSPFNNDTYVDYGRLQNGNFFFVGNPTLSGGLQIIQGIEYEIGSIPTDYRPSIAYTATINDYTVKVDNSGIVRLIFNSSFNASQGDSFAIHLDYPL